MRSKIARIAASALLLGSLAAAPAAGEDAEPRRFTIAAAGDILIHESIWQKADSYVPGYRTYDFFPLFAPIEPWISEADLAICHLEVPLSPDNSHISTYPRFSSPHELADAIKKVGFDTCSTASNHSLDQGYSGLVDTLEVLDAAGLEHAGTARSKKERHPALYDVAGVKVGHISYTYGTNGLTTSIDYAVNSPLRSSEILADAAWARGRGAEFVMVSLHWGAEYVVRPLSSQVSLANTLLASPDIDVILGHHVHVVQPIDRIGTKVVVYGMSNLISNIRTRSDGSRLGSEDGVIVHLEVTEQPGGGFLVTDVEYTPTWVHPTTKKIMPVEHWLEVGTGYDSTLRTSRNRTVNRINLLGVADVERTPTPWPEATCRGKAATMFGSSGDDEISGSSGADVIIARGGDDTVRAGAGNDRVCLGSGNDEGYGRLGDDLILGGPGDDVLRGNDGNDRLIGNGGRDLLVGGDGEDRLKGGAGSDELVGRYGDDQLRGARGGDLLLGGPGNDSIDGGPGRDVVEGRSGDDAIWGGPGDDRLNGGTGPDTIDGGEGLDICQSAVVMTGCTA
jgi:poly-gamma-glutamate synthesis protein (capsule biosynthesis protein)